MYFKNWVSLAGVTGGRRGPCGPRLLTRRAFRDVLHPGRRDRGPEGHAGGICLRGPEDARQQGGPGARPDEGVAVPPEGRPLHFRQPAVHPPAGLLGSCPRMRERQARHRARTGFPLSAFRPRGHGRHDRPPPAAGFHGREEHHVRRGLPGDDGGPRAFPALRIRRRRRSRVHGPRPVARRDRGGLRRTAREDPGRAGERRPPARMAPVRCRRDVVVRHGGG